MAGRRTGKCRRGFALPAAPLALAVLVAFVADQMRVAERAHLRHEAEGTAQRIDTLAWHLDHWVHDNPAMTAGLPTAPRRLTAAETSQVTDGADFAAPWLRRSDAVSVGAAPPPSAHWHVRFAVGWPSGSDPSAAGIGPPYGVVVASPLNAFSQRQSRFVAEALRRRGGGVPTGDAGSTLPATGAAAVEIAQAAGMVVGSGDVAVLSWRHGAIQERIALRRARAGFDPPGMAAELELAGLASIDHLVVAGDAEFGSIAGPAATAEADRVSAAVLDATALEVESGATVAGAFAAASLTGERFESPAAAVRSATSATFRLAVVQGDASASAASVQSARVTGVLNVAELHAGLVTGIDLETPVLDLSGGGPGAQTRVTDRFYARHLRLTGNLDVSSPGYCRGCLNDP